MNSSHLRLFTSFSPAFAAEAGAGVTVEAGGRPACSRLSLHLLEESSQAWVSLPLCLCCFSATFWAQPCHVQDSALSPEGLEKQLPLWEGGAGGLLVCP